jgi:putative transposase
VSRLRFVDDHRGLYEVKRLCARAEASRQGYYAWRNRPTSARALSDGDLLVEIIEIHQRSRGRTGDPGLQGSSAGAATA